MQPNRVLRNNTKKVASLASLLLVFCCCCLFVDGHPEDHASKYGLSRATCRAKWEQCLDGTELDPEEPRPTPEECRVIIRRRYDCAAPPIDRSYNDREGFKRQENDRPREEQVEETGRLPIRRRQEEDGDPRRPRDDEESRVVVPLRRREYAGRDDEEDDPKSIEIDQRTKTVSDNTRSKYSKTSSDTAPTSLYQVRRRDKVKKEKERIFVKEDIIELDEDDDSKKTVISRKKRPNAEEKVKEMNKKEEVVDKKEAVVPEEEGKKNGVNVVKMLQRGLL